MSVAFIRSAASGNAKFQQWVGSTELACGKTLGSEVLALGVVCLEVIDEAIKIGKE